MTAELGRFWTDYTWDTNAGLPVMLQETYREKTGAPQKTRYTKTYVYGVDPSTGSGQAVISVYTDDVEHATTAQDYYFSDGLGSTVTLARDSAANEGSAYTYDAFGALRSQGGALSTSFLFTGEQFDAKARTVPGGLYYLRARYYDPTIGRFLTRDPLPGSARDPSFPEGLNAYPYVQNNPVNRVDPSGMLTEAVFLSLECVEFVLITVALVALALAFAAAPWALPTLPLWLAIVASAELEVAFVAAGGAAAGTGYSAYEICTR